MLLLCGLTLFIENKLSCHLVCKLSSLYAPCRASSSLRYVSFQAFTFNFAILKFGYVWEILWGLIFGALLLRVSHVQICVDLSKCLYFFCFCIPLLFFFFLYIILLWAGFGMLERLWFSLEFDICWFNPRVFLFF